MASKYLDMIADLLVEQPEQDPGGQIGEWRAGVAELGVLPAPVGVRPPRWHRFIADAEKLLATWGTQADALGWSAADLFGLHPVAPAARVDCAGVAWLLDGRPLVAMTAGSATIRTGSGKALTFRRKPNSGAVVAWRVATW